MKYFIYDSSNDGIVWAGMSPTIANRLKQGLLDCELSLIQPHSPIYEDLTGVLVKDQHLKWDYKTPSITEMMPTAVNELYIEKKRLAYMRLPAFASLMSLTTYAIRKNWSSPIPTVENDISFALTQCQPASDQYHHSITEYSQICNMTEAEAYKELKLYTENLQSLKIRIHAYVEYFSRKINAATADYQIEEIKQELTKKFIKDNYI